MDFLSTFTDKCLPIPESKPHCCNDCSFGSPFKYLVMFVPFLLYHQKFPG